MHRSVMLPLSRSPLARSGAHRLERRTSGLRGPVVASVFLAAPRRFPELWSMEAQPDMGGVGLLSWRARPRRPRRRREKATGQYATARMRRFDVRALGWVVTCATCSEIARRAFGRPPTMSTAAFRELGARWRAIHAASIADQSAPRYAFLAAQRSTRQSKRRDDAVIAFVDSLQSFAPDLYSEQALRRRCLRACAYVIVSLALGAILASWAPPDMPSFRDASVVLFAMASWYIVAANQLWHAHLLVKRIGRCRKSTDAVPRAPTTGAAGLPES
jgi:hypothetical protein